MCVVGRKVVSRTPTAASTMMKRSTKYSRWMGYDVSSCHVRRPAFRGCPSGKAQHLTLLGSPRAVFARSSPPLLQLSLLSFSLYLWIQDLLSRVEKDSFCMCIILLLTVASVIIELVYTTSLYIPLYLMCTIQKYFVPWAWNKIGWAWIPFMRCGFGNSKTVIYLCIFMALIWSEHFTSN